MDNWWFSKQTKANFSFYFLQHERQLFHICFVYTCADFPHRKLGRHCVVMYNSCVILSVSLRRITIKADLKGNFSISVLVKHVEHMDSI